jgi:hypothetical protein
MTYRPTKRTIQVTDVHTNVDQEIIQITDDKLKLILKDYITTISRAGDWVAPISVFISIIATFCTAKFDTFIGLEPGFWKAFFAIVGIVSLIWGCVALWRRDKIMTLDELINKVKNKF